MTHVLGSVQVLARETGAGSVPAVALERTCAEQYIERVNTSCIVSTSYFGKHG